METFFASTERSKDHELQLQIEIISQNSIVNGLLDFVGGLLAVLNEHRQILALNETLLSILGIKNAKEVLGLRPGEALQCIHADDMPGGCGTGRFCSTCGAAIAIVTSLKQDRSIEKTCALTVNRKGKPVDLYLSVRSYPISFNGTRLLLLFLQDISKQQQWAILERVFFHDINNILTGLVGESELLTVTTGQEANQIAAAVHQLALRLTQEIKIQQFLSQNEDHSYHNVLHQISLHQIFTELRHLFENHPSARNKRLNLPAPAIDFSFRTDVSLLMRVLGNMVTNALEATEPGEEVKLWFKPLEGCIQFFIWNKQSIPADVASRIFQRNFSTKQEIGRGLGTYSMKLFGEEFLRGKVTFTSSEIDGTTFCFTLPI